VDTALAPVHDQTRTAKAKNHRRSVNTQVVLRRRDRRVVTVCDICWPGNRNHSVVYRATTTDQVAGHPRLIGDGGYRGVDDATTPRRGTGDRIIRDDAWNRLVKRRPVVEHVIAPLKTGRSCASAAAEVTASTTP
jgi:hypothetical protein